MSTNRSRMAVIGPIIGFILIYVIIRYAVGSFQTDLKFLGHMGAVTIQEVQHMAGGVSEAAVEEAAVEEAAVQEDVTVEAEVEEAATGEEATEAQAEEPAAEEESSSHD